MENNKNEICKKIKKLKWSQTKECHSENLLKNISSHRDYISGLWHSLAYHKREDIEIFYYSKKLKEAEEIMKIL